MTSGFVIAKRRLKNFYVHSKLFEVLDKIYLWISKIIFSSKFYKTLFHKSNGEKYFAKSFAYRFLLFLGNLFIVWPSKFLAQFYEKSLTKKLVDDLCHICVPEIFLSSATITFISNFFGLNLTEKQHRKVNLASCVLACFFVALFFAVGFCFLGLKKSVFIIAGLVFFLFVFHEPKLGIYSVALFLALLPTKFILGIVCVTLFSFWFNLIFSPTKYKLNFGLMDVFVGLFFLLVLNSVLISYMPLTSLPIALVYFLFMLFYFVCKNLLTDKKDLFTAASCLIFSSFIVAVIGICQKYFNLSMGQGINMWIDEQMFSGDNVRVFSTLDNPNVLGEYLLFTIPLTFASLYYFKDKWCRLFSFFVLCGSAFCMLLTLSRGAWLGLIISMFVFVVLRDKKFLWLGVPIIFLLPFLLPQSFLQRFMSIGNLADSSTSYRVSIWIGALRMLKDFWPVGIGLGPQVFIFVFQKYALSASYALHSHNFYLEILIELGLVGFLLIGILVFMFYKNLLADNKFLTDDFLKTFKVSLCAGFTGYLVQGFADNVWYNYRILLLFWFVLSISAVCCKLSSFGVWEKFKLFSHKSKFN